MAVRAKFYVAQMTQYANAVVAGYAAPAPRGEVILRPVTRGGDDNAQWASATPSGEIKMTVNDGGGFAWFHERLGQDIAITFDDPKS